MIKPKYSFILRKYINEEDTVVIRITQKIKSTCYSRLLLPLCIAILMTLIFLICPFLSVLHPTYIKDMFRVNTDNEYVRVKADSLHYTGYDLIKLGGSNYGYYYGLQDGKSIFAIIPVPDVPKLELKNYEFTAKVIRPNRAYKKMLSAFTKDLN